MSEPLLPKGLQNCIALPNPQNPEQIYQENQTFNYDLWSHGPFPFATLPNKMNICILNNWLWPSMHCDANFTEKAVAILASAQASTQYLQECLQESFSGTGTSLTSWLLWDGGGNVREISLTWMGTVCVHFVIPLYNTGLCNVHPSIIDIHSHQIVQPLCPVWHPHSLFQMLCCQHLHNM